MQLPCKCCKHEKITHNGIRIFVGCDNKEREKQFVYDDLFYWHKCKGQEVMDKCLNCIHYEKPYCNSVKAKDENNNHFVNVYDFFGVFLQIQRVAAWQHANCHQ